MCTYVYVHIGSGKYFRGYVEYACGYPYFVLEPLIQPKYKRRWSDKSGSMILKSFSLSYLLGSTTDKILAIFLYPIYGMPKTRKQEMFIFAYIQVKRNNFWNLTFTAPQTLPDKSSCDWSRAIIGNQSEHTRQRTASSFLGYKYKHRELSFTFTRCKPSKQDVNTLAIYKGRQLRSNRPKGRQPRSNRPKGHDKFTSILFCNQLNSLNSLTTLAFHYILHIILCITFVLGILMNTSFS